MKSGQRQVQNTIAGLATDEEFSDRDSNDRITSKCGDYAKLP